MPSTEIIEEPEMAARKVRDSSAWENAASELTPERSTLHYGHSDAEAVTIGFRGLAIHDQ